MIRQLLHSVLCMGLSPLLIAQQVTPPGNGSCDPDPAQSSPVISVSANPPSGTISLTNATEVDLDSLDPVSSATAKVGTKMHFRVVRDVFAQNTLVIREGSPVTGTIEKMTVAKKHHREGRIKVRLDNLTLTASQTIRLSGVSPENRLKRKQNRKDDTVEFLRLSPLIALILPYFILLAILWDDNGPPTGDDIDLGPCVRVQAYTVHTTKIQVADLPIRNTGPEFKDWDTCTSYRDIRTYRSGAFQIE